MDGYPNPYAALIATFNQVSPQNKDDLDDPQNLPDDDLLLWANAQFTYDMPPGVGIYEDDMGVKLAMSQQQFQHTQQQHQQQQQQQQQQFQPQQQQPQSSLAAQQQQQHALQYQSSDMQRQLQQFDAIHRYLDSTSSEDPRTSLAVVERSRQRNPATTSAVASGPAPQPIHYDPRMNVLYPHTSHAESSTSFSAPTTAGPISPAAARLLRQPFLSLQTPHVAHQQQQQQQPQQSQAGPSSTYSVGPSPLTSPTTMSDFHHLQITPLPPITPSKPNEELQALRGISRKDGGSGSSSSSSASATTAGTSANSPANSSTSTKANASSGVSPREEEQSQAEKEMDEYDLDLDLEDQNEQADSTGSSSSKSKILAALEGLSQDDPEYATRLAAEEDKRRRNTAASARFRHKKRLREQILEKTAKEMTAKSEMLEVRVRELEMEIKWLRGLIVEKDSRSLDVGATTPTSAASPASLGGEAVVGSRGGSKTEGATLSRSVSKAKRGKKLQS